MAELFCVEREFAHRQPVGGRQNRIRKHQQQFVDAVEFLRLRMQAHQPLLRMQTLLKPQIFYLLRGAFHPRQRSRVRIVRRAGDIQHPGDIAIGALQRHGGAIKSPVAGQEMLAAIDFAAVVNRQRGANGVGSASAFAPQIARR